MQLQKATRKKVKIKIGLSSVAGGGKTKGALLIAKGLVDDWTKIAVIDSENESAALYSDMGEFNHLPIQAPYTPEKYIQAIEMCEQAGMECIIVDSITHEWDGAGGCLDIVEELTKRDPKHNSYTQWRFVTPRHQAFIDAMLQSKCHVVTTVRRKQDYEMTKNGDGKVTVTKAGLKEITRDGFEYELTVNIELDQNHNASSTKDRTGLFQDKPSFIITEATGKLIKQWCDSGVESPTKIDPVAAAIAELFLCTTLDCLSEKWKKYKHLQKDPAFLAAKDQHKTYLSTNDKDLAGELNHEPAQQS